MKTGQTKDGNVEDRKKCKRKKQGNKCKRQKEMQKRKKCKGKSMQKDDRNIEGMNDE